MKTTAKKIRTVDDAIRAVEKRFNKAAKRKQRTFSHFLTAVRDGEGKLKYSSPWRHNLTTDTASGYTNRRDWQSKALGGSTAAASDWTGAATNSGATSLTNSGANWTTTGQGLAGMIVACGPNSSGSGSTVFGVIVSNTSTVLTVDQWYSAATPGGAAGSTPSTTANYQILPGQMPAMFLALSTDSGTPLSSDTTLTSEISSGGLSRALGTFAHTAAATTYTLQKVFNATSTFTINKEAVFGSIVLNKGVMPFESAEPSPPTLISGDQLTQTVTITIN